jgi:uroporphyrin-III C-methyltransferase / precorrin-2 dehydrogenase / sirohydrochlorin ferrochelatase
MIASLPLFHRLSGQPVIVLGAGEAAEAKRRLVERAGGVVADEAADAKLAFVALDAPETAAAAAAARLRARGILVNVVDRPELCDFTVPSILDRSPVLLAIGTGGASAGLAKALRLRLEALLPQRLGALAPPLAEPRAALRARWPDAGQRRRALDAGLAAGGPLDPLGEGSADGVADWLAGAARQPPASSEIRLRSADPDDLTLREARLLGSADVLAHEPAVPPAILNRARADAARVLIGPGEAAPVGRGLIVILRT